MLQLLQFLHYPASKYELLNKVFRLFRFFYIQKIKYSGTHYKSIDYKKQYSIFLDIIFNKILFIK